MNKITKAVKDYLEIYLSLEGYKSKPLYAAVDKFDRWFVKEMPTIAYKMLQFNGDVISVKTPPEDVIRLCEMISQKAKEIIQPALIDWVYDNFDDFYKDGIKLANINLSLTKCKDRAKLDDEDKAMIESICVQEINVWKSHFPKMTRQLERELWGAIYTGRTFDFFMARMTAPDLHIVGFPYGNSRYSWYEHIKRFVVGRPKMVASMAQQRKVLQCLQ